MVPPNVELPAQTSNTGAVEIVPRIHPTLRLLAGIGSLAAVGVGIIFGLEFAASPTEAIGGVSAVVTAISVADAAGLGYIAARGKMPFSRR